LLGEAEAVQDEMSSEGGGSPTFRRRQTKEAEKGGSPIHERERHPEEAEPPVFKRKIKELEEGGPPVFKRKLRWRPEDRATAGSGLGNVRKC